MRFHLSVVRSADIRSDKRDSTVFSSFSLRLPLGTRDQEGGGDIDNINFRSFEWCRRVPNVNLSSRERLQGSPRPNKYERSGRREKGRKSSRRRKRARVSSRRQLSQSAWLVAPGTCLIPLDAWELQHFDSCLYHLPNGQLLLTQTSPGEGARERTFVDPSAMMNAQLYPLPSHFSLPRYNCTFSSW